ncbi:MAG: hypothetical protein V7642_3279 [Burkholderiales bacterium]
MKHSICLLLWFAFHCAFAQDEGHLRFLKFQADYRVNSDATYSAVTEISYLLLTESALVESGKAAIHYSTKLEEVEVLEAYTLKKDGSRIPVGAAGVQIQDGQLASGYDISQVDRRKLMITFPQLEVGDSAVYKYRLTGKVAIFQGQFFISHAYSRRFVWNAVDISIDAPSSIVLQTEAVKMDALPVVQRNGRRIHRWRARNLPIVPHEPASVDLFPGTPHLVATTFRQWGDLAAAYEARSRPKAAVTPAIKHMANRITKNVKESREQARLLYEWVAKNVRYVASWIGAEGWVPHDAESVLEHRYGDCKDHAVLLDALLAAKGIASSAALINRDKSSYSLPSVVYPAFNHVITYLPAFDLYLDSTTGSTTPFGVLPVSDLDKPVIHTSAYGGPRRTPMITPAQFSAIRVSRMAISDDGAMSGELSMTATGPGAIELRELQQSLGQHKEAEWVRDMLDGQNFEGEGNIAFEEGRNGAVTMRLNVNVKNFLAISDNGTIPLAPLLVGPIAFDTLGSVFKRSARTLPYWCPAWTLDDRYEIRLPRTWKLLLPRGKSLEEAGFSYSSRYQLKDGILTAARRLSIQRPAMACPPQRYAVEKPVVLSIERDLRAQVIYQTREQRVEQMREQAR